MSNIGQVGAVRYVTAPTVRYGTVRKGMVWSGPVCIGIRISIGVGISISIIV